MMRRTARRDRILALFCASVVVLNPPIINLISGSFLGLPSLYVYFFAIWALIIAALVLVSETSDSPPPDVDGDDKAK